MSETKKKQSSGGKTPKSKTKEEKKSSRPVSSSKGLSANEKSGGEKDAATSNIDFEAGMIFNRYDSSKVGFLTTEDFRRIWRDAKSIAPNPNPFKVSGNDKKIDADSVSFDAGQIFAKFDANADGRLDPNEFENVLRSHPEILSVLSQQSNIDKTPFITAQVVSYFDETSGVAIPRTAVEQHRAMGNTVVPLIESFRARYERLRTLITGRLLPRREYLVNLRRKLLNCSSEVSSIRKGIERETLADTAQILDRLRSVEALRQSSLKHQTLLLDEELEAIERLIHRVELSGSSANQDLAGIVITSAAPGSSVVETVSQRNASQMIELIQQFADICATIEKLSTKKISVQVDFPTDDFPKETSERLEIISRCDKYMHAVAVKDHMLWSVIKERDRQDELLEEERNLAQDYALEVASWAEMSQTLASQVQQLTWEKEQLERRNNDLMRILREHHIFYAATDPIIAREKE